jgi:hypothetical protein
VSNEITLNASLAYEDSEGTEDSLSLVNILASVTSKRITHVKQSIGTSETALSLGGVSSPGWCLFVNRDTVNYVELKVATSGAIFGKLPPGGPALIYLGSGAQVPYALANGAACQVEALITSA